MARGTRELILAASDEWIKTRPERAYLALGANYAGVKQRWRVVYTRSAHARAEQTVNKQHLKQNQAEYKMFNALSQQTFACATDAEAALAHLQKKLKVVALDDPRIVEVAGFKGKGRPRKGSRPDTVGYRIEAGVASVLEVSQITEAHHGADDDHEALSFGLWRPGIPHSTNAPTTATKLSQPTRHHDHPPSVRWVFQFFAGIHVLLIDCYREIILNCNEHQHQLLKLLGEHYVQLYARSG